MSHAHDYNLDELEQIEVRGLKYHIMPRYKYHYLAHDYEDYSADLMLRYLKPGSTVVDVGGHYGFYSLLAARQLGAEGKIFAYEPVPENAEIFRRNIAANGFTNVSVTQAAVSDKPGELEFNVPWASDSAGFYNHPLAETHKKIKVNVISLDEQFKGKTVDWLKIDTEGHELVVLEGAKDMLRRNPQLKIMIEFNPSCLISAGREPIELLQKLDELGFAQYDINDETRHFTKLTGQIDNWQQVLGERTYTNLFCLPKKTSYAAVFVSHTASQGGAEDAMLELVSSAQDHDAMTHVVIPGTGSIEVELKRLAVSYDVVPFSWWARQAEQPQLTDEQSIINSVAVDQIVAVLKLTNADVALSNTMVIPWAALAASVTHTPHTWLIHEFGDLDHRLVFEDGYDNTLRYIDASSAVVVANSKAVEKHIGRVINHMKLSRLYYPPRFDATRPLSSDKPLYRSKTSYKLHLTGRITPSKGQLEAVQATAEVLKSGRDVELMLVGWVDDQVYRDQIGEFISDNDLDDKVYFASHQSNVYPYLHQADAVLMCSTNEAFGRVTLEGLMFGKPVIGANAGGTPEIIEPGVTGLLYEAGNAHDLATQIIWLYDHQDEGKRMGEKGKAMVAKTFSFEVVGGHFDKLIRKAISTSPSPAGFGDVFGQVRTLASERDRYAAEAKLAASELEAARQILHNITESKSWKLARTMQKTKAKVWPKK